jgi:ABC-type dipeptide/oligopeptide/nickel transport system permease subunit
VKSRGYSARSLRRLARDRGVLLAVGVLAVVIVAGVFADQLAPYAYNHFDLKETHLRPTAQGSHFFGTDSVGHDTFSQTLYAIRTSVLIGLAVAACASLLGLVAGALAGYFGGWFDAVLMRAVDFLATIPILGVLFVGIILTQRQPRPHLVSEALILCLWTGMARVVRARLVSLRQAEYVDAARSAGASGARIVVRHLIPNATGAILVTATGLVGQAILLESTVEFFGFGFDPWVTPSLGGLVATGVNDALGFTSSIFDEWWLWGLPAAVLVLVLVCVNFLGDSLDDALNPAESH